MKYYAVDIEILAQYGMGDESWRKKKLNKALVSEAEVTDRLGYASGSDFERDSHTAPMNLMEAREWARNL